MAESCVVCGVRLTERGVTAAEARRKSALESVAPNFVKPVNIKEALPLPVSGALMAVRAIVGALATALGTYILVLQDGVVLTPMASMVVLAYGFVGLYWILSALMTVSLRQFLLEMLAFLIATVGLRVDLPQAFDSEQVRKGVAAVSKLRKKSAEGKEGRPIVDPADTAFRELVESVVSDGIDLVTSGVPTQDWMAWKEQCNTLRSARSKLSAELQNQTETVMRKLVPLERAMEQAVGAPSPDSVNQARKALETLENDGYIKKP